MKDIFESSVVPAPTVRSLKVGDVVAERSERGTVTFTGRVVNIHPCIDRANLHVTLQGTGKYLRTNKAWCSYGGDSVEKWTRDAQ